MSELTNYKPHRVFQNLMRFFMFLLSIIFGENIFITELPNILESNVYNSNDSLIGKLMDLHFKYDCIINRFI